MVPSVFPRSGGSRPVSGPPLLKFVASCALLVVSLTWALPLAAQELPDVRSVHDGVYTEEQAEKGAEVFRVHCASCHTESNPVHGSSFLRVWSGQSLWPLYQFVSMSMPYGGGGTLSSDEYRAVMAYMLQLNGYPAGSTPFPDEQLDIAFINLDPH